MVEVDPTNTSPQGIALAINNERLKDTDQDDQEIGKHLAADLGMFVANQEVAIICADGTIVGRHLIPYQVVRVAVATPAQIASDGPAQ